MSFMQPDMPAATPTKAPKMVQPEKTPTPMNNPQQRKKPFPSMMGGGMDTALQSNVGGKTLVGQ